MKLSVKKFLLFKKKFFQWDGKKYNPQLKTFVHTALCWAFAATNIRRLL